MTSPSFRFRDLRRRLVGAPMAGGPSTPELAAAVTAAGGLGQLAGGYLGVDALAEELRRYREVSDGPVGVNLFVADRRRSGRDGSDRTRAGTGDGGAADGNPAGARTAAVADYAAALAADAAELGVQLPGDPRFTDYELAAKVDLLVRERPAVVGFTFGIPAGEDLRRLREAGIAVLVTVASVDAALAAAEAGADAVCVQGLEAGGHRSTLAVADEPDPVSTRRLLVAVRSALPRTELVAAGGVGGPRDVAEIVAAGADAVQVGTALLRTPEAGTGAAYRAALVDPRFTATEVTRCFSGRPARGLVNGFVTAHSAHAPAVYPEVNVLTGPLRAAAAKAGDAERLALWAGTAWRQAHPAGCAVDGGDFARPAGQVVAELWDAAVATPR